MWRNVWPPPTLETSELEGFHLTILVVYWLQGWKCTAPSCIVQQKKLHSIDSTHQSLLTGLGDFHCVWTFLPQQINTDKALWVRKKIGNYQEKLTLLLPTVIKFQENKERHSRQQGPREEHERTAGIILSRVRAWMMQLVLFSCWATMIIESTIFLWALFVKIYQCTLYRCNNSHSNP